MKYKLESNFSHIFNKTASLSQVNLLVSQSDKPVCLISLVHLLDYSSQRAECDRCPLTPCTETDPSAPLSVSQSVRECVVQGGSDPAAAAFSFQATCTQFRSDVPFMSAVVPLEHCIISIFSGARNEKIGDVISK